MTSDEIDLLKVQRGAVVAPAGCGKTQLITDALRRHAGNRPILVLTHTNAGVAALRHRLETAGVPSSAFRLATLDGFAIRLISMFPERSGHDPKIITSSKPQYETIRNTAIQLIKAGHLTDLLQASYERLFVDEYQDCSVRQHAMIAWLAQHLPTAVVGDPFQAIFGFGNDGLPDWDKDVLSYFPLVGELKTPWRWNNAGAPLLGNWLLAARDSLARGSAIDLRTGPGIEWVSLDGVRDESLRLAAGAVAASENAKVLIIGDSRDPASQRRVARKINGAVTVEAVDLRDLTDLGRALDLGSREALAVLASFAEGLTSNFGAEDLVRTVAAAKAGPLGRDLSGIEEAALVFETAHTAEAAGNLLSAISQAGGVYCYRPAVLAATQRALQLASAPGAPSFAEATVQIREQSRLVGRPLATRSVGSTLLLKGLEAEISVILDAESMNARNLYVAMTRGSQKVVVCSASPLLSPQW